FGQVTNLIQCLKIRVHYTALRLRTELNLAFGTQTPALILPYRCMLEPHAGQRFFLPIKQLFL
ncbi:MAG: hypothetical protein WCK32_09705, partial [Chlorobiaceae bacterium]